MEFQELFVRLNDGKLAPPTEKRKWEDVSNRLLVHAKGIRPPFDSPRKKGLGGRITPPEFEERFQYIFDNHILNRHPNEQDEHYQFRLSLYAALSTEIFDKGKAQVGGSIFQNSQYTIAGNDENSQQYLDSIEFEKRIKDEFFQHILTDPYGKFAIVETHYDEFGSDEKALPNIELIESRYILHFEPKESILFQCKDPIDGLKVFCFLDKNWCIKLVQPQARKKEYVILTAYEHGIGRLPVVDNGKEHFKSFVTWAELIGRNFSDDEIVAKNNNHPYIQMREPVCNECMGQCVKSYPCSTCESGWEETNCKTCNGRGTISINPGEVFVVKEKDMIHSDTGQEMPAFIKLINPDVAISKNSMERCQYIYEMGLRSLHLKHTEEAQSGTAKAIDREQLYLLISTVSSHIFDIADKLLMFVFGYLDMGIAEQKPYTVEQPTQFQIKTESDIQQEMIALAGADLSVRRQKTDEYMQTVLSGNQVELKKWNTIKVWDFLYCMTDDEIQTYKLLMGVTDVDIRSHAKVEVLLNRIILDKGGNWFINALYTEIIDLLDAEIAKLKPATAIEIPQNIEAA